MARKKILDMFLIGGIIAMVGIAAMLIWMDCVIPYILFFLGLLLVILSLPGKR